MRGNNGDLGATRDTLANALTPGAPVFDAGGHRLGTVDEYRPGGTYFCMRKGLVFHKDVYIPLHAVAGANSDGVRLRLTDDEVRHQDWSQPPTEPGATSVFGLSERREEQIGATQPGLPTDEELGAEAERTADLGRLNEPGDTEQTPEPPLF